MRLSRPIEEIGVDLLIYGLKIKSEGEREFLMEILTPLSSPFLSDLEL
ncbi:hypothetical protein SLEP1_g50061 [Rubroshorea leprosula]|uniref:Uncharacterized protein n=1 Tax=Rubroshorea leprosula TaxID=152421 RepID=A0AAV5LYS8_9ROSI|nr:hypothetical protein SLEP1_g50061 [Rubroshorea leprosula]